MNLIAGMVLNAVGILYCLFSIYKNNPSPHLYILSSFSHTSFLSFHFALLRFCPFLGQGWFVLWKWLVPDFPHFRALGCIRWHQLHRRLLKTQNWHSEGKGSLAELGWPKQQHWGSSGREECGNKWGSRGVWGADSVTNEGPEETEPAPYSIRALPRT